MKLPLRFSARILAIGEVDSIDEDGQPCKVLGVELSLKRKVRFALPVDENARAALFGELGHNSTVEITIISDGRAMVDTDSAVPNQVQHIEKIPAAPADADIGEYIGKELSRRVFERTGTVAGIYLAPENLAPIIAQAIHLAFQMKDSRCRG